MDKTLESVHWSLGKLHRRFLYKALSANAFCTSSTPGKATLLHRFLLRHCQPLQALGLTDAAELSAGRTSHARRWPKPWLWKPPVLALTSRRAPRLPLGPHC